MTALHTLFVGVAGLSLAACSTGYAAPKKDAGDTVTRSYPISGFHAVSVAGPYDVTVSEGGAAKLTATGGENVLAHAKISVEDGVLKIETNKESRKIRWTGDKTVKIVVTGGDKIDKAAIAGSGDLDLKSASGANFKGSVAGSGDLSVAEIKADEVKLSIAGSGEIRASGTARTANYSIAGSGDVNATTLRVGDAKISIAGSGEVRGHASGEARVNIAGSGDVSIDGGANCTVSKSGSGNVRCN